jgi:hypothetical protein
MDDVEILGGFTVTISGGAPCLSLELKGNAILNIDGNFSSSQPSLFEAGTTINWAGGSISCSLLVNQGTMNLTSSEDKSFGGSTLMNNNGTINIIGSGDLFLRDGTVLNNQINGTIDMRADDGNIDELGGITPILNNAGIIRRSTSAGEAKIWDIEFNNNGGIIQVDSGALSIVGFADKNFTGGSYVVSAGTVLNWDTTITVSGFLMGTIEGDLNWNNGVSVPASATFNFSGGGNFNWTAGALNGGGILTNQSTLNLTTVIGKSIQGDTTLNNSGTINIVDTGNLIIQGGSVVNNLTSGVIDMQADTGNIIPGGGGPKILNNMGLIKRTTTTGIAQISVDLNNNDGIIQVESGILSFFGVSGGLVKNLTDGTYNVSSGALLDWDGSIELSGVLSGTIDGTLNWDNFSSNTVSVPGSATLNFTGLGNVNWVNGTLSGGGVLTNQSTLNFITNGAKIIIGDTTLNNSGTINIVDMGDLFINQGIVNNQASGVINLQADGGDIRRSGGTSNILNNIGLIKRTTTTGTARIDVELNNNDGIIQVENGILSFGGTIGKNLTDGTYNISSGAVLDWDNLVSLSGDITGVIDGALNWDNVVSVPGLATLNFTGSGNVNWNSGTLNGGGVLTNQSTLNLITTNNKSIIEDTTLNNSGTINIVDAGDLFITQGIVNNQVSGVIDLQVNNGHITMSGGTSNILNNAGLIKRTTTTGTVRIDVELNNSGTIEVETGELEIANSLPFTNEVNGIIKGVGIFDLPLVANYTNDGIFAPGLSPGTLTVQGDYQSTTNSVLDIELNGLIQDTEYDLLAIQGNASFNGDILITLGFDADVNDEFIIATTTGTISNCNLPLTKLVGFNGSQYEFSIACRNNNELVLTITNETLGIENFEEGLPIVLYPNPATDMVSFSDNTINNIEVFDINGRRVLYIKNTNTFSVKSLSNGIYIVKAINNNNETITKKLIKN